jgi:putative PIN family toxin of toxin-antitoxin system
MLRIVLDANIFVSAVLKPKSDLAKIFDLIKDEKLKLILSSDILSEIREVLLYPKLRKHHRQTVKEIDDFLERTIHISRIASGKMKVDEIKDDPEDNKYLAAAVDGEADFIISGDHHLKNLRIYQGIRILDPSAFLKLMQNQLTDKNNL